MKQTAKAHSVDHKGHGITGNVLRNESSLSVHGRSASKMSVADTNRKFKQLAYAQAYGTSSPIKGN